MSKAWLKDGKVVMRNGSVTLCDSCPCGEPPEPQTCTERVQARVDDYLEELEPDGVTYKWHVVSSYSNMYTCATMAYDPVAQRWNVVGPASGYLWVIFHNSPLSTGLRYYIIEGTLLEDNDGNLKLVACTCSYTNGVCSPHVAEYNGYWVAGALPVQELDASDSDSQHAVGNYDPCAPDLCEVLKLFMSAGQERWGGELVEEGYVEHNTVPCEPQEYPRKDAYYMQGWVFFWDDGTGMKRYANLLRCGCNDIVRDYDFNETRETSDSSDSDGLAYTYEYRSLTGICTSPCQPALTLANSAAENGQKLYHEGVFFPRDGHVIYDEWYDPDYGDWISIPDHYEWGDTYDFSHSSDFYAWWLEDDYWEAHRFLMCKDNGDGTFSLVTCECDEIWTVDIDNFDTMWTGEYPTDGKPIILPIEYSGACKCLDLREIVMAHAEECGIVDASMGSNTIWQDANASNIKAEWDGHWYDTGLHPEHVCFKLGDTHLAGTADLLDYRSLCIIKDYGWRSTIFMLTPDKLESEDIHGSISQALIRNAVMYVTGSETAAYSFTGHMDLYTYRAAMDDYYYYSDIYYDPDDPESEFPGYCDTGEMPIIWAEDHRHVVAVLRNWMYAKAWWVCQGYRCNCGPWSENQCESTPYEPPYDWGNPTGGPVPQTGSGYGAAGATTNMGFVLQGGGDPVTEVSINLCTTGEDYTFARMTPKGEPKCTGHNFTPPGEDSDSGDSESEEVL